MSKIEKYNKLKEIEYEISLAKNNSALEIERNGRTGTKFHFIVTTEYTITSDISKHFEAAVKNNKNKILSDMLKIAKEDTEWARKNAESEALAILKEVGATKNDTKQKK